MACIKILSPQKGALCSINTCCHTQTYHFIHQILPDSVEVIIYQRVTLTGGREKKHIINRIFGQIVSTITPTIMQTVQCQTLHLFCSSTSTLCSTTHLLQMSEAMLHHTTLKCSIHTNQPTTYTHNM